MPPSTAAGKVTPVLSDRLSARKRLQEAKALHQATETHHEPNFISINNNENLQQEPSTSSLMPSVQEDSPVTYNEVSKSVSEFLALEKEAADQEKEHVEVVEAPSKKAGPTIFSVLPAINEGKCQPPLRMDLPPPKPMQMAPVQEKQELEAKKKVEKKRAASKPVVPRGTTAPQKRAVVTKAPAKQPIAPPPKSIVKPFLKRAESAKRLPVGAEPEVKVIKDGNSEVQVFQPGAFGAQQERQRGVRFNAALANGGDVFTAPDGVQFNVIRSVESSMMASGTSTRGSFAEALRMAQLPPPCSTTTAGGGSSSAGVFFGGSRPDLFMEDEGEFINMPSASSSAPAAQRPENKKQGTSNDVTELISALAQAEQQEYDGDLPVIHCPELPDDEGDEGMPRASASPAIEEVEEPEPESARPEDVLPTGFSMEEKALMAALNKINKKAKKVEDRLKGKKSAPPLDNQYEKPVDSAERSVLQSVSPNVAAGAINAPFAKYQPTPFKSRRQAGGRRYIGIQPQ